MGAAIAMLGLSAAFRSDASGRSYGQPAGRDARTQLNVDWINGRITTAEYLDQLKAAESGGIPGPELGR